MADMKIFAGPRVRRMRNTLGITQTAMAEGLGISPSYLNLIEHNRRKVTLWRKYGIIGVALFTPLFLTPIGGTLVANAFGDAG